MIPAVEGTTETDVNAEKKHIVGPKLIAYLKWLFYIAAFKDSFEELRGARHSQFYVNWVLVGRSLCQQGGNIPQEADGSAGYLVYNVPTSTSLADIILTVNRRRSAQLVLSWTIPRNKTRALILDQRLRLTTMVLVATAVQLINE